MRSQVLERITTNPLVMGGKPCIRGIRVTVSMVAGLLRSGHPVDEILELYPCLEREDIDAVVEYERSRMTGWEGSAEADEGPSPAATGASPDVEASPDPPWSPQARRVADAIRALPEPEQEYVLARIITSLEEEGGETPAEVDRLWRELAQLEFSRVARRFEEEGLLMTAKKSRTTRAGVRQAEAGAEREADGTLTYVVRTRHYPFLVEGTVDGLPFCLVEEGDRWRFAVSRDPAVDPRTIRSSREGWVAGGGIATYRVQGKGPPMTDDQLLGLIEISRHILVRRVESGRAQDAPGLLRGPGAGGGTPAP